MDSIKQQLTPKNILVVFLGAGIFYVLTTTLINAQFTQLELQTRALLADQQATMVIIAEATARGGADTVTESIIHDCPLIERNEFDVLLGRLDAGLSPAELTTLERLFGRCGSFFSSRKAVMVARLSREVEVYETYVDQLSLITGENMTAVFPVQAWQELAIEEQKQSEQFSRLVGLQNRIITTLLAGKNLNSPEMQEILDVVRVTQEALTAANRQATSIRAGLVSR